MNERVKELRLHLGLSGEKFGEKIGINKNSLSQIETGKNSLTEQNILSICREFHVNEKWLRTGEGEMFVDLTRDEEIASFVGELQAMGDDAFQKKVISALAKLSTDEWRVLEALAKNLLQEVQGGENNNSEPSVYDSVAAAEAAYEKSLGIVRSTESVASSTTEGTERRGNIV